MDQSAARTWPRIWRFAVALWRQFFEDHCPVTAAALTYQTLFAIVPLLTLMYTVFSMFEAFSDLGVVVEEFVFSNVVPENIAMVQGYLRSFSDQARQLSLPSVIVLAATAALMLATIEKTLNEIWGVREPRHGLQRLWVYWAVLTLGPLLVGCGLAVSTYVFSMPLISDVTGSTGLLSVVPFILGAAFLTLIYLAVPNCNVPVKYAAIGGTLAAVIFESAKYLFASLVARTDIAVIYGTFAAAPLLLMWIYLCWTILLIGAEFVKMLTVFPRSSSADLGAPMFQILYILDLFRRAHLSGTAVDERAIYTLADRVDLQRWSEYRALLMDLKLIRALGGGELVLAQDLHAITLWDLHRALPWPLPAEGVSGSAWARHLSETFTSLSGRNQETMSMDVSTLLTMGSKP